MTALDSYLDGLEKELEGCSEYKEFKDEGNYPYKIYVDPLSGDRYTQLVVAWTKMKAYAEWGLKEKMQQLEEIQHKWDMLCHKGYLEANKKEK